MRNLIDRIQALMKEIGRPVRLMEVCGTHTVAIFRHGIRDLLPEEIILLSGPGCPVCVTSVRDVDAAIAVSREKDIILTTFGDMMRVPGSRQSLFHAKAEGGDIRIVYSPLDALKFASEYPDKKIVFFATGFETTSPSIAGTLAVAEKSGIRNFYIYSVHKTVPPALKALLDSPDVNVDGFILPGHVSAVIGSRPYGFIAGKYRKPSVITGFEASDILSGISMLLEQIASDRPEIAIQYTKVVKEEGNTRAVSLLEEFFIPTDAEWRGIGVIPESGLGLRTKYRHRDIGAVLDIRIPQAERPSACSCGDVLRGVKMPPDCSLFGKACTPEKPVGPCMVSSEGSCAAYYKYQAVRS
jgi:hydrogenase expression/formation protein HypD